MMSSAVAIISKLPREGRTKTRLARTLGVDAALRLHRAFLADELAQLTRPDAWTLHLVHEPVHDRDAQTALDDVRQSAPAFVSLMPGATGLAAELHGAMCTLLATHDRAVIVSGDVPHIDPGVVLGALAALDSADLVLGPGPDGGYYLVGLRAPHDVFTPVQMSTGATHKATLALARSLGLVAVEAPQLTDLDEAQDLLVLEDAPVQLARQTRAVVAGLERGDMAFALPSELQVEASSRCNLRCAGCIRTHDQPEPDADLSLADFRAIIDPLPGLRRVAFQLNGESMLNDALFAMIALARQRGARTVLNTNGTLLDARRRTAILDSGLDELRISLDGATAQSARQMAGADVFERVVAGTRAMVADRGDRTRPRIGIWMIATQRSLSELPAMVDLAAGLGVDEVYTQRLVLTGEGVAQREHSVHGRIDDALLAHIAEAERIATARGIALRASGRRPVVASLTASDGDNPRRGCWRPWRSAVVTASKRVIPCCISSFTTPIDALEVGDLRQEEWPDLWNGERYRRLRRGILSGEPERSCTGCGELWSL